MRLTEPAPPPRAARAARASPPPGVPRARAGRAAHRPRAAPSSAPSRTSTGRWSTSAAAAACPGWCSRWPGRTSTSSWWRLGPSAAASSRRPSRRSALDAEVVEGRAEVVGRSTLPGDRRRGGGPELRPAGGHRRVRAARCCGSVAGWSSASRPRRRSPTGGRRPGLRPARPRGDRAGGGGRPPSRCSSSGRRARRLPPPRRRSRPSSRCSERAGVPRGTPDRRTVDPRSRVSRGTSRTGPCAAPAAPGRMQQ